LKNEDQGLNLPSVGCRFRAAVRPRTAFLPKALQLLYASPRCAVCVGGDSEIGYRKMCSLEFCGEVPKEMETSLHHLRGTAPVEWRPAVICWKVARYNLLNLLTLPLSLTVPRFSGHCPAPPPPPNAKIGAPRGRRHRLGHHQAQAGTNARLGQDPSQGGGEGGARAAAGAAGAL